MNGISNKILYSISFMNKTKNKILFLSFLFILDFSRLKNIFFFSILYVLPVLSHVYIISSFVNCQMKCIGLNIFRSFDTDFFGPNVKIFPSDQSHKPLYSHNSGTKLWSSLHRLLTFHIQKCYLRFILSN